MAPTTSRMPYMSLVDVEFLHDGQAAQQHEQAADETQQARLAMPQPIHILLFCLQTTTEQMRDGYKQKQGNLSLKLYVVLKPCVR